MSYCTGNCDIQGFLVAYCTVCGWDDGYTGGGADPYEHQHRPTVIEDEKSSYKQLNVAFVHENAAQIAEITDPITREMLMGIGFELGGGV